jgi:hypothetical protein
MCFYYITPIGVGQLMVALSQLLVLTPTASRMRRWCGVRRVMRVMGRPAAVSSTWRMRSSSRMARSAERVCWSRSGSVMPASARVRPMRASMTAA